MIKEEFAFLNRLSDINNNAGIKFLSRAAAPGSHCPLHMALGTIKAIKGVSSLVVGMAECGYYSRFVAASPYGGSGELHYVYELDSSEVVFGCREGLKEALFSMDREGAKVITVIITCVPALIGEDTASLIDELKPLMAAKVVFIDAAHFKRNGYQYGYFGIIEQLIGILNNTETKAESQDGFINPSTASVNLFGAAGGKEFELLKEIILENGYEINEYSGGFSFDDLCRSEKAVLSIIFNRKMLKAGKALENKGVPYVNMADRYSAVDIEEGYKKIRQLLNLMDYSRLRKGKEYLLKFQQEIQKKFEGITYIATYPELDILPVAGYLCSLGMIPELLHVEEFEEESFLHKENIIAMGHNPYITYITDRSKVIQTFFDPIPELSLGSCTGLKQNSWIPDSSLASLSSLCGFERSRELLSMILKTEGGEAK